MFLHVSVHGGSAYRGSRGICLQRWRDVCLKEGWADAHPRNQKSGRPYRGEGVPLMGGRVVCLQRGLGRPPPEPETRAVRILLECFLVILKIFLAQKKKRKCETGSKSPLVSFMLPFILISTWNYVVLSDSAQGTSYSSSCLWCRIQYDG